jgi:hypothetical protein
MNKLTAQELQFLIDISEEKRKNGGYYSKDVVTENTLTHDVSIYFIIQKLEKQLNQ